MLTRILISLVFALGLNTWSYGNTQKYSLALNSYQYHEGFETADPFVFWASNGSYTVNSKGLSTDRANSGTKSFKLDVTLPAGVYLYYKIPLRCRQTRGSR